MHEGCKRCGDDSIADADVVRAEGKLICTVGDVAIPFASKAAYEYDGKSYSLDGDKVILISKCDKRWVAVYWVLPAIGINFVNAHFNDFAAGRIRYVGKQTCVRRLLAPLNN